MNSVRRAAEFFSVVISIAALGLELVGGALVRSIVDTFKLFGLREEGSIFACPLGTAIFLYYACGIALGLIALHWLLVAGLGAGYVALGRVCVSVWRTDCSDLWDRTYVCGRSTSGNELAPWHCKI